MYHDADALWSNQKSLKHFWESTAPGVINEQASKV